MFDALLVEYVKHKILLMYAMLCEFNSKGIERYTLQNYMFYGAPL